MKIDVYKFYKEKYNLEQLNLKVSNKKIMFLIYDSKFNYMLDDNIILENKIFDILEKKFKKRIKNE